MQTKARANVQLRANYFCGVEMGYAHYMDMIAGRLDEVKRENTLVIRPNTTVVLTTEITTIHMIYLCVGFSVFGFSQAVLFLKRFSRFSTLPISSLVHTEMHTSISRAPNLAENENASRL